MLNPKKKSGSISRVLYSRGSDGHYTRPAVASRFCRQVSPSASNLPAVDIRAKHTAYLVLQAAGFTVPPLSPATRCALTAPFHPYLCPEGPSADYSLWHFPAGCPGWPLATTVALPCSDFPPDVFQSSDRPTHSNIIILRN